MTGTIFARPPYISKGGGNMGKITISASTRFINLVSLVFSNNKRKVLSIITASGLLSISFST